MLVKSPLGTAPDQPDSFLRLPKASNERRTCTAAAAFVTVSMLPK
jgi:hypothetical protein